MEAKTFHHKELERAYGQNTVRAIQKLVKLQGQLSPEEVQAEAQQIVYTMLFVSAGEQRNKVRPTKEKLEQVWQHFFELADFKIDVQAPVPVIKDVKRYVKPEKVPIVKKPLGKRKGLSYLGNLTMKTLEAIAEQNKEEQAKLLAQALPLMHQIYTEQNQTEIEYEILLEEIFKEFPGKFKVTLEEVLSLATPPNSAGSLPPVVTVKKRKNGKRRRKWRK